MMGHCAITKVAGQVPGIFGGMNMTTDYRISMDKLKSAGIEPKQGEKLQLKLNGEKVVTSEIMEVSDDHIVARVELEKEAEA